MDKKYFRLELKTKSTYKETLNEFLTNYKINRILHVDRYTYNDITNKLITIDLGFLNAFKNKQAENLNEEIQEDFLDNKCIGKNIIFTDG